jgi:hypothetical protein
MEYLEIASPEYFRFCGLLIFQQIQFRYKIFTICNF